MERCFVIQPFDGGPFDARYDDVIDPAVRASGLEPYRVDRDPKASIPIQEIETQIRSARICLADITVDNPNVWFELGFAIAAYKDVVLICADQRQTKFPFDIQHRSIITYKTGSPRDFQLLQGKIQEKVVALLDKEQALSAAMELSRLQKIHGLEQHEVVALAALGENLASIGDAASMSSIRFDMERSGFTNLATTIALRSLVERGLVEEHTIRDEEGYSYPGFKFTGAGWSWVLENKDEFVLKKGASSRRSVAESDVPF
ncbi:hypothetical protein H4W19_05830 [Pseudoxanthomonas mexicana]|uniref:MarR family transcriptional regulator n=1 Tax=Pseudoxanthomonas mexicana TaxID=128785 RepID=A0ABX6REY5_PSEMX|nr:hypothetical protein [Pseudoxanthomonas mexicana]QLQ28942.1 MAG: hypothetical protein HZT39_12380 [Pseudoxanthomonas sp.]QND81285.1 hypothetical protein H4W19_05830 [Pseudoxanthomonas mexicana]